MTHEKDVEELLRPTLVLQGDFDRPIPTGGREAWTEGIAMNAGIGSCKGGPDIIDHGLMGGELGLMLRGNPNLAEANVARSLQLPGRAFRKLYDIPERIEPHS